MSSRFILLLDSLLPGKQDELNALWKKCNACPFLLTKGKEKGNACGNTCTDTGYCASHYEIKTCTTTMKNGKPCGKNCVADTDRCSVHKKTTPVIVKTCLHVIKRGELINTRCGNALVFGTEGCARHGDIRVTKHGQQKIIKGTNVLFDCEEQVIIGYVNGEKCVYKENEEARVVGEKYDLPFRKM